MNDRIEQTEAVETGAPLVFSEKLDQSSAFTGATLSDKIRMVVAPFIRSLGLELFDLQISGRSLRIFIDKEGGVALEDCENLSRLLGPALDVADHIPNAYTLEVSSPGLNRPLRHAGDFQRFVGKKIKVITTEKMINQKVFVGRLSDFNGEMLDLLTDEGEALKIPLNQISKACLEIEFPAERRRKG